MKSKTDEVYRETPPTPNSEYIKKNYILGNIRKEIILGAEISIRKRIMGSTYFLQVINLCLQRSQTWDLIRIRLKGKRIGKTLIIREAEKVDISHSLETSLKEADIGYKICGDKVAASQTDAEIIRHEFIY